MASDQTLIKELVRAKMINAKREKEALSCGDTSTEGQQRLWGQWEGQEIMAKQILDILEGA